MALRKDGFREKVKKKKHHLVALSQSSVCPSPALHHEASGGRVMTKEGTEIEVMQL